MIIGQPKLKVPEMLLPLRPEILTHPNVPKPLHGVNPRIIFGQAWWDKTRQKVYEETNYHCIACGVHKLHAEIYARLEAHEFWNIDYNTGRCEVTSIVPLCHSCHMFIHSGRMSALVGTDMETETVIQIIKHGYKILKQNNLKAYHVVAELAAKLGVDTLGVPSYDIVPNPNLGWEDLYMVYEGQEFPARFKNLEEWKLEYMPEENKEN